MFTVYGLNGRVYSGALEGLRDLEPVRAAGRLRATSALVAGASPDALAAVQTQGHHAGQQPSHEPLPHVVAAAAYVQASKADQPGRRLLTRVRELMTPKVLGLPATLSLSEAWQQLLDAHLGQAPVLDAEGRPIGLLVRAELPQLSPAHTDLQAWSEWREQLRQPVTTVMLAPLPAVSADTPIREVSQVLHEMRLPGLPVVEDETGRAIGFISRSDLLRAIGHEPPLDLWS
ncbi:CBS domain-containing protein [Pelomonas sp. SE-A7]|uniref:CBS domain-containing protein n=1 Tax=Pelomonas sp. SE-A7 TaxID=3054953 RepID=UPI00259D06DE|nr:CBS domain-containing protein [Pelomonas sp. SE-A7]MDM4766475.1 CBS domain-containing protein [Pelomonas sp. SE-A7]